MEDVDLRDVLTLELILDGTSVPSPERMVYDVIKAQGEIAAYTEIIQGIRMKTDLDQEVSEAFVTGALAMLENRGRIQYKGEGYWVAI